MPSGAGTTHTAHGIVFQEVKNGADVTGTELPNVPKLHERTAHPTINDLESCFAERKGRT